MAASNRRRALACLIPLVTGSAIRVARAADGAPRSDGAVPAAPVVDRGGPDASAYGRDEGYPVPPRAFAVAQGNPWPPKYRVGAFSHLDAIYATHRVPASPTPWVFGRGHADVRYEYRGRPSSLADYLARNPVTGLLVARDDRILFEHYQYARSDKDRLLGQSMTKSLIGLLMGIAIADGAIESLDDTPQRYVPGFKGSEYGRTPIRHLLHMSSGVDFGEERDGGRDLNRLWRDMVLGSGLRRKGTLESLKQFDDRVAPAGTRFRYASIEPDVLGLLLRRVLDRPLSEYLTEKVWHPAGAEADATWLVDAEGIEVGHFGFSAALRDYARIGRLMACDGAWGMRQLVPSEWMREATTVRTGDGYLAPGSAMRHFGYGYLLWLLPGSRRQFAMVGVNGQRVCVDAASRLVMVHTALEDREETWRLWSAIVEQLS